MHKINPFLLVNECLNLLKNIKVEATNVDSSGNTITLPGLAKIVKNNGEYFLRIYTENFDYITETTTVASIYPGGKHTLTIRGWVTNPQALLFTPNFDNKISFTVTLAVKKECKTALPVLVGSPVAIHESAKLIVSQYDGQTPAQIAES